MVVVVADPRSAAASAGIESGDVITAVDGQATAATSALSKVIDAHKIGQTVSVSLGIGSGIETVSVRLGEGPIDRFLRAAAGWTVWSVPAAVPRHSRSAPGEGIILE